MTDHLRTILTEHADSDEKFWTVQFDPTYVIVTARTASAYSSPNAAFAGAAELQTKLVAAGYRLASHADGDPFDQSLAATIDSTYDGADQWHGEIRLVLQAVEGA